MTEQEIDYPTGKADIQSFAPAAAVTLTIKNQLTFANASAAMAAGMTLNFTKEGQVRAGARVIVKVASDGTARTVTPGTGATGTAEAGVISKTKVLVFELDSTGNFILQNARQID